MILAHAQSARHQSLRWLCEALGILRQRYPDKAGWKEMGERVRQGAGFLNDASWRAGIAPDDAAKIQKILEKFWEVMNDEDSLAGLEMNTALLWATDESQRVGATSHKFIEW
ncbi:hypothetical protein EXIGLDRAFT_26509 [Exidia glandulosa HHB12029]|uniref:Uncharacterized protein n=1 Tax=Exidia glandulosa HHB12029 TaxID=1314781 RepID=A0A165P7J7_EXIGL|nr:hypothetical protein EXIGLDRAFT_26509 [Exidia glandulosa HHB12029]